LHFQNYVMPRNSYGSTRQGYGVRDKYATRPDKIVELFKNEDTALRYIDSLRGQYSRVCIDVKRRYSRDAGGWLINYMVTVTE